MLSRVEYRDLQERMMRIPYEDGSLISQIKLRNALRNEIGASGTWGWYGPVVDPTFGFSELTVAFRYGVDPYEAILSLSREICNTANELTPTEVNVDESVTGVVWADGKTTLTRCADEDEYMLDIGLMNNYLRKETSNRGSYFDSAWSEPAAFATAAASAFDSVDDMRECVKYLEDLIEAHELIGDKHDGHDGREHS